MVHIYRFNPSFAGSTTVGPIAFLIVGMLICADACAEGRRSAPSPSIFVVDAPGSVSLESAYWKCDYDMTHSGVSLSEGALCGEIYEELKRRKFGGDFQALLTWWQQNKLVQHEAIRRKLAAEVRLSSGAEL